MPRGHEKKSGLKSEVLGGKSALIGQWAESQAGMSADQARTAIEQDVSTFAWAWFAGDAPAMLRCLHPEFVNRLMGVRGDPGRIPPEADPELLVESVVGLQGRLGSKSTPARRRLEVRVLDVRSWSASAVALLGDWVLHVHLARAGLRWSIVNAMWEMA